MWALRRGSIRSAACPGLPARLAQSWVCCGITRCRPCSFGVPAESSFESTSLTAESQMSASRLSGVTRTLGALSPTALVIAALVVLRLVVGALLPLSSDEAYYWLWSKHLEAGYLDHPPAIAWLIRMGTSLFGDTPFGVRMGAILCSVAATWFVWRAAADFSEDERAGARAALWFNLTLMAAVEMLAATPDAPALLASAAFLYVLVRVRGTSDGRWWLIAGIAGGLALLSKFTALFLAVGALGWTIA